MRRSDEQNTRFIARAVKMATALMAGRGVHSPLLLYNCCKVGADKMHTEFSQRVLKGSKGLYCIIVLPWLGCFAAKGERVSVPATLPALYHSTETMVSNCILRYIK